MGPAASSIPRGVDDLIDSTDFLPTLIEAGGGTVAADQKLDGRSFLPQLRGEKGTARAWYYVWYAPNGGGQAKHEFAAGPRYKLSRWRILRL